MRPATPASRVGSTPRDIRRAREGPRSTASGTLRPGAIPIIVQFGDEDFDESVLVTIYDPVVGYAFGSFARHELARTDWWSGVAGSFLPQGPEEGGSLPRMGNTWESS